MICAVDTNVLLRSIDVGRAVQSVAQEALIQLRRGGQSLSVFSQNLIEFWAVATRPVRSNGLGLSISKAEVEMVSLKNLFTLLPDTPERSFPNGKESFFNIEYPGSRLMTRASSQAMTVQSLTHLLTFNTGDFKRFAVITATDPRTILDGLEIK